VRSNVQRNKINVERSRLQLEQVSLDLESNVYQAYNDAKNSKKFYEAAVKTAEARRLAFEYAKERYDVGLSNAFDFNQSRVAYENAQSDIVRTKFNYIFSLKVLEFYFGVDLAGLN
jgi:outer membrane protein